MTIIVDNKPYDVTAGQHLLEACLALGFDLPYFCWHPALGSVGACRQCAVKQFKDEKDQQGKIVMACMTPAAEGTRISIDDPEAREFRASVIEWLMVNHPHDCPICDEGGECHLQDMTVMTGHVYREFRFKKRTYQNQYLGPFLNHEMNRCIQCYRCVRFYREYAGGRDLDVFGAHDNLYFGRHEDGVLESEFSGNLVEVCPTGVFTDKTLKQHYTRKWDLQTAPSICVHCGLGCNTIPGERYGQLRRVLNRYHHEVNGYFLCDRGRYGYEFVNSDQRIRQPLARSNRGAPLEPLTKEAAIQQAAALWSDKKVIGIGSPRASLEANFALRTLVGSERFCSGMLDSEHRLVNLAAEILRHGPARSASIHDAELADAVLVLGEDVINTAPRLALALRQSIRRQPMKIAEKIKIPEWNDAAVREAVQDRKGPLFLAAPFGTRLDDAATATFHAAPDDLARLGFAVARALDDQAPPVNDISPETQALAEAMARALRGAERPLVVSGTGCGSEAVLRAAANVAWALCRDGRQSEIVLNVPECNSLGQALMGGISVDAAVQAVRDGQADTLIILENDLSRRADAPTIDSLFQRAKHVIVIDHLQNAVTAKADLVLPAATVAEASGTLVSNEGRAQRFYRVFAPEGDIQDSWRWLRDLAMAAGREEATSWDNLDSINAALARDLPIFKAVAELAPAADFRVAGLRIPRKPHRYSGRTAMYADLQVHEPKPPPDPDSPLAFSMEGLERKPPSALLARYWAPGWNSVQSLNKFQSEINGPLRDGDPGCRVIEPDAQKRPEYFHAVPEAFAGHREEWLAVPAWHIFGSEELSSLSRGVAERAPQPYIGLNPADARQVDAKEGQEIEFASSGQQYRLRVKLIPSLPDGVVALPVGLPGTERIMQPAWIKLRGERHV